MNPAARAAAIVAAVVASAVVWHNLPANSDVYAPFTVHGTAGAPVSGRAVNATVTGVRAASTLRVDSVLNPVVAAVGRWVVVDADIRPGTDTELPHADLVAGADTYQPTDRLQLGTMLGGAIQPGITTTGSWVFDVAPAVLEAGSPLALRVWVGDGRLDSRLDIAIPPTAIQTVQDARVTRPQQSAS